MSLVFDLKNHRRDTSNKSFAIVHESLCGHSELDFENGFHLCLVENIININHGITAEQFIETISEKRPDLFLAMSSYSLSSIDPHFMKSFSSINNDKDFNPFRINFDRKAFTDEYVGDWKECTLTGIHTWPEDQK